MCHTIHSIWQCEGVPQAKKLIGQMLELFKPIKESIGLGIQPEAREATKNGMQYNKNTIAQLYGILVIKME